MSDVSQGPGWWLASDYKWYPPELHPDASAAATDVDEALPHSSSLGATDPARGAASSVAEESSSRVATKEAIRISSRKTPLAGAVGAGETSTKPTKEREPRRSSLVLAVGVLVLIGAGVLAYTLSSGSSNNSISSASADRVKALATEAVLNAGSVHVVSSIASAGQVSTYVNDTAANSGRQVISLQGAQVTTIAVGGMAYVDANEAALSVLFRRPSAVATQFAGKWLSFGPNDVAFKQLVQSLTLGSLLQQIMPTGAVTKLPQSVVAGKSVVGLRGDLPGGLTGTLYVSTTGSPLPVEETSSNAGGATTTIFSDWGESVTVAAPPNAIPGGDAGL